MQFSRLCLLAAGLAAGALAAPASPITAPPGPAERGLAFAQAHCAGCHGIGTGTVSFHPEAPPFADIANRPGVTEQTLRQFLGDSHNFPGAMNFRIEPASLDDLAAYLAALRQEGYRPAQ